MQKKILMNQGVGEALSYRQLGIHGNVFSQRPSHHLIRRQIIVNIGDTVLKPDGIARFEDTLLARVQARMIAVLNNAQRFSLQGRECR